MKPFGTALAAVLGISCVTLDAQQPGELTLDDAFARVVAHHPDLAWFRYARDRTSAEMDEAALKPALSAELEFENVLGTGDASGLDMAEITLSLASVIERGKREARSADGGGGRATPGD